MNDLRSSWCSGFLTLSTPSLETGRAGFGGGPFLPCLSHSLGCTGAQLWRDERRKPHLTSPFKPRMMPPFPPPGPVGTCCGGAMMPGHGVAHRSGNVFLATTWHLLPPSFMDELVREKCGARISKGCHGPSRPDLPQRSTARSHPSEAPADVHSCGAQTTPIFLALHDGFWASFHTSPWQSRKASSTWHQPESISARFDPCSPSPTSASSLLSSRLASSPVLPGKACVVLNLQLRYSIK